MGFDSKVHNSFIGINIDFRSASYENKAWTGKDVLRRTYSYCDKHEDDRTNGELTIHNCLLEGWKCDACLMRRSSQLRGLIHAHERTPYNRFPLFPHLFGNFAASNYGCARL